MANELKATIINMKTLSQDIADPIVVGASEGAGRTLRVIFTQEAAAQFTKDTKVYLSWHHQEMDIKGYNIFTEIKNEDENWPPTWEIKYPKSMLYEGNVIACIQIVDDISISTSVNFIIHILIDPNDGSNFIAADDFTEFQKAIISLTTVENAAQTQMEEQAVRFEEMQIEFDDIKEIAQNALNVSNETVAYIENITTDIADITNAIEEITTKISDIEDKSGLKEEDVIELIGQKLINYVTKDDINNYATIQQLVKYVTQDQLKNYVTLEEIEEKLNITVEEVQDKHNELWNTMQFVEEV